MRKKYQNILFYFSLVILYSLIFILIYGYTNFDIHYTDWLMVRHAHTDSGDITINFLNFLAFLNDDMKIPYLSSNAFPFITSTISIDYAPIIMIPVKIFYKYILHYKGIIDIQYVWYFGIISFILQGLLSFKIIKKLTDTNNINAILCSIFFVIAPPLLFKFPYQFTLCAHFLILLSFLPFIYNFSKKQLILFYFFLSFLTCGIMPYFIPMVFINIFGFFIYESLKTKYIIKNTIYLISYFFGFLISYFLFNGYASELNLFNNGFREFSANLNTFINPINVYGLFKSNLFPFLNNLKTYQLTQNEGFSYLGGGFLVLFLISVITFFVKYRKKSIKDFIYQNRFKFISIGFIVFVTLFWALSFDITLSDKILISIDTTYTIEKYLNIFRSPGRIIWNNFYIVYILVFVFLIKNFSPQKAMIIISVGLILQIYDMHSTFNILAKEYRPKVSYENPLNNNSEWLQLVKNKKNIIIEPPPDNALNDEYYKKCSNHFNRSEKRIENDIDDFWYTMDIDNVYNDFYHWAIYHKLKMNSLIRSRRPKLDIVFVIERYNQPSADDLYIFHNSIPYQVNNTKVNNCVRFQYEYAICTK